MDLSREEAIGGAVLEAASNSPWPVYSREARHALILRAVLDYLVNVEGKADVTTDDLFECTRRLGFTWEETRRAQGAAMAKEEAFMRSSRASN
jgi:hypothetical protein